MLKLYAKMHNNKLVTTCGRNEAMVERRVYFYIAMSRDKSISDSKRRRLRSIPTFRILVMQLRRASLAAHRKSEKGLSVPKEREERYREN
jgi:hypothetical protein